MMVYTKRKELNILADREDMNTEYVLKDYGPRPLVINIDKATKQNTTFRTALWTGTHLQVTLMSINVGEEIGAEVHPELDQFLRIEQGQGLAKMGTQRENLNMQAQGDGRRCHPCPGRDMAQSDEHGQHTVKIILNLCPAPASPRHGS